MSPSWPNSFNRAEELFLNPFSLRTDFTLSMALSETLNTMGSLEVRTAEQFFAFWHRWPDQSFSLPVSRSFEAEDSDSSNEDNLSDSSSFNEWLLLAASELNKLIEIYLAY